MRLLARTGQPIEHAYWGRIVHDLSGVQAKETVPLDHRHDPYQVIGFGKAAVESGDLWVSGALVPFQSDDVAAEIAYKASRGVPYEASIDFRGQGIVLEELGVGAKAKVNGYTLEGPAVIVRKWPLRAVAICECGADPGTKAEFSDGEPETVSVDVLTTHSGDRSMSKGNDKKTTTPGDEPLTKLGFFSAIAAALGFSGEVEAVPPPDPDKPAEDDKPPVPAESAEAETPPAETPADAATQVRAEMKRFTAAFGKAGLDYFADGKTFDEAAVAHVKALEAKLAEADKKLGAVDRGEGEPAEFSNGDEDADAKRVRRFSHTIGPRLGAFAASIKLPSNGKR